MMQGSEDAQAVNRIRLVGQCLLAAATEQAEDSSALWQWYKLLSAGDATASKDTAWRLRCYLRSEAEWVLAQEIAEYAAQRKNIELKDNRKEGAAVQLSPEIQVYQVVYRSGGSSARQPHDIVRLLQPTTKKSQEHEESVAFHVLARGSVVTRVVATLQKDRGDLVVSVSRGGTPARAAIAECLSRSPDTENVSELCRLLLELR